MPQNPFVVQGTSCPQRTHPSPSIEEIERELEGDLIRRIDLEATPVAGEVHGRAEVGPEPQGVQEHVERLPAEAGGLRVGRPLLGRAEFVGRNRHLDLDRPRVCDGHLALEPTLDDPLPVFVRSHQSAFEGAGCLLRVVRIEDLPVVRIQHGSVLNVVLFEKVDGNLDPPECEILRACQCALIACNGKEAAARRCISPKTKKKVKINLFFDVFLCTTSSLYLTVSLSFTTFTFHILFLGLSNNALLSNEVTSCSTSLRAARAPSSPCICCVSNHSSTSSPTI